MTLQPPPSPLDYALPEKPEPRHGLSPESIIFVLGLSQLFLTAVTIAQDWPLNQPTQHGPLHTRVGQWLTGERSLLVGYGIESLLAVAIPVFVSRDRRRRGYALLIGWWTCALTTVLLGMALTSCWPGEHRFRWVAQHNVASDGRFGADAANMLFWWSVLNTVVGVAIGRVILEWVRRKACRQEVLPTLDDTSAV